MNAAIILGRLTRDPVIKATQSGMTIARFTLAVNRLNKKGRIRKRISSTAWHSARLPMSLAITSTKASALSSRVGSKSGHTTGRMARSTGSRRSLQTILNLLNQKEAAHRPVPWMPLDLAAGLSVSLRNRRHRRWSNRIISKKNFRFDERRHEE